MLNILVGDATAGQAYFAAKCSACHSATGDLRASPHGSRSRAVAECVGRRRRRRRTGWRRTGGGGGAPNRGEITVTVTTTRGQKVEGRLDRIDDFIVTLTPADGVQRTFRATATCRRSRSTIRSPGTGSLLPVYTDKDIHDVTAYLVTLK